MERGFFARVNGGSLEPIISASLDWIGWRDKIRSDSVVFVKPNFTLPKFRPGLVTSPQLQSTLLPLLKSRASRLLLVESDVPIFRTATALQGLGIDRICRDSGTETIELSRNERARVSARVGRRNVRLSLPRIILEEVDVVVNAAVPKCHVVTGMSGAMKNFYGLIPDPYKYRHYINRALVAVNKIVPSDLVVKDCLYSLAGRGPILGFLVKTQAIIAAENAVVADLIVCRIFEMNPSRVGHLKLAMKEKMGPGNLASIEMNLAIDASIKLRPERAVMDYFAVLTFKSRILNMMIMQSPLTALSYQFLRPLRSTGERKPYRDDIGTLPKSQFKRS